MKKQMLGNAKVGVTSRYDFEILNAGDVPVHSPYYYAGSTERSRAQQPCNVIRLKYFLLSI
jgi:hypothetical protein